MHPTSPTLENFLIRAYFTHRRLFRRLVVQRYTIAFVCLFRPAPNEAREAGRAPRACDASGMMAGDFHMYVMARVLFSIAILTIATPALAKGDTGEDRRLSAEILNPKMAEFYYYRGTVYYHMDKYDDAITDYDLAIRLRRNYADAYYNRGLAFDGKGLLHKALGDLRKALTCNAFSISASPWTSAARAKIMEIETRLSADAKPQVQTSAASVAETVVK